MSANISPIFVATPFVRTVQISTANTGRDGTGTLGTLVTGGANGTRIDFLQIEAAATVTGGMIRFFIDNGTNVRLWRERTVTGTTPSATVKVWEDEMVRTDNKALVFLPSGYILKVATNNAETFNIVAVGGDY